MHERPSDTHGLGTVAPAEWGGCSLNALGSCLPSWAWVAGWGSLGGLEHLVTAIRQQAIGLYLDHVVSSAEKQMADALVMSCCCRGTCACRWSWVPCIEDTSPPHNSESADGHALR